MVWAPILVLSMAGVAIVLIVFEAAVHNRSQGKHGSDS